MAKSFFKFFLLFVFVLGIFFLLNNKVIPGSYPSEKDSFVNVENTDCPDMLIRKDNVLLLYNSNKPKEAGKNPKTFRNLDEYINHLEVQRSKGIKCPVLFLQSEVNAQGEEVYRMRPSPFDMQGGTQLSNNIYNRLNRDAKGNIIPLDATRDRNPYNKNNYPGFDAHNLHMGQFTSIDDSGNVSVSQSPVGNARLNFILSANSIVKVLPFESVIRVEGNVYSPGLIAINDNSVSMYKAIELAGGRKPYTLKKSSYVLRANGEIDKSNFFGGRLKRVYPGDTVVVPVDPDPDSFDITTFIADLSTTLANIAAILIVVDNNN